MKIFLSYSSEQGNIAKDVYYSLVVRDYEVFFDKEKLGEGKEYGISIPQAIKEADLFIVLISPDLLTDEKYIKSELRWAKEKWKNPSGKVLPVMAVPTNLAKVDAYLKVVTILFPQGNLAAEVAVRASQLLEKEDEEQDDIKPTAELQQVRISAYRKLWEITKVLPKWPRAKDVSYDHLLELSKSLRDWYFHEGGGMFLSTTAYAAYAGLQDTLTAICVENPAGNLAEEHYETIRELCSALRHSLTKDIGSR